MTDQKITDPADLLPGDVMLSMASPGTWVTVTNIPRHFLGEVLVDARTASGGHFTIHFAEDASLARRCAFRPGVTA